MMSAKNPLINNKFPGGEEFKIDTAFGLQFKSEKILRELLAGISFHPWQRLRVLIDVKGAYSTGKFEDEFVTFQIETLALNANDPQGPLIPIVYRWAEFAYLISRMSLKDFDNWLFYHYLKSWEHESQEWLKRNSLHIRPPH